ncbi:MAG: isoprenylcysteine carboxylmethyltransferase family protein [Deltaproteobacteria bacterium]|nr:isoprenylcysteine carboxylmethyltransferase family protein [Deltaproteobacteria bacterium]
MTAERDGAKVRLPPPLVYLLALLVAGGLHGIVPLRLPLSPAARAVGAMLGAALGVAFLAGALGLFRRTGQDPKPWKSTPSIVSSGVYRRSRNPMYVGMALLLLAIGWGWGNGWVLLAIPLVLAIVYATAIRHEEAYLEAKFGDEYLAYKRSTRRWL